MKLHNLIHILTGIVCVAAQPGRVDGAPSNAPDRTPIDNTWAAMSSTFDRRGQHTAVWTGSEMIVWGGYDFSNNLNSGGIYAYNSSTDFWAATSTTNAPHARVDHTAVWAGSEMIIWGGDCFGLYFNTGGRYNPDTNSWTTTSTTNAPSARSYHTAVWTGSEMIIWGGYDGNTYVNSGRRYNPHTNSWTTTSTTNAPSARSYHTAVWTGSEMIVWGGYDDFGNYLNTGGRYNPATNSWTATSTTNAPSTRSYHTAVWTGSEMIVWGGGDDFGNYLNTGGRYNPGTNSWTRTSTTNAPDARVAHTAVWTGSEMIVWGGKEGTFSFFDTGGRYNPSTNSWTATSRTNAPYQRYSHTSVWTGSEMIVWGGFEFYSLSNGGRYCASGLAATNAASNITSSSATLNGVVDPNGLTTTVHFEYGITTNYGATTANGSRTGNTTQSVGANITGLSPNTTYHFRLVATNTSGTRYGSDKAFTTFSPTGPPVVATSAATNVASFGATLNGSVYPHALITSVYFQYGTTTSYGLTTVPQTKTGNTYQSVSANIGGLRPSTTYHFRLVTTNSAGTRYGSDRTFTTLPPTGFPVVTTNPATNVTAFAATLNGSLDPHWFTTTVYFQYGTTTGYGHTTPIQSQTGNTYRNIAANIGGLATHTTYHFRIVATNTAGTSYGSDRTFTTQ